MRCLVKHINARVLTGTFTTVFTVLSSTWKLASCMG